MPNPTSVEPIKFKPFIDASAVQLTKSSLWKFLYPADSIKDVHAMIRRRLNERFGEAGKAMRILYGGSVKAANAEELMAVANVDGALVGGASLKAQDFLGIIEVYRGGGRP